MKLIKLMTHVILWSGLVMVMTTGYAQSCQVILKNQSKVAVKIPDTNIIVQPNQTSPQFSSQNANLCNPSSLSKTVDGLTLKASKIKNTITYTLVGSPTKAMAPTSVKGGCNCTTVDGKSGIYTYIGQYLVCVYCQQ
jgi:hypothetical protein